MNWKEPTFGATPMMKALTAANARRKARAFDLVKEQKQIKLNYPAWAQEWFRKYKEAWYIANANGDQVGMRQAQKLAEGLRSKLREMATMPKWAQEQMQKQTVRWMEANASGNIKQKKAAEEAGKAIRDKLAQIQNIAKTSPSDAEKLNDLTAKWYAAHDHGIVDGKDMRNNPEAVKAAMKKYSQEAEEIRSKQKTAKVSDKPKFTVPTPEPAKPNVNPQSGKWIPPEYNLNGNTEVEKYLNKRLSRFTRVKWDQKKVHELWEATKAIDKAYGIQIDPRFLLAVIIHEGTGSFNTSSTNKAADGQNGVETDYAKDLMKANNLIFGKILGYIYYGQEFRLAVSKNNNLEGISGEGDIYKYTNWKTPIIRMNSKKIDSNVYAGDGTWYSSVKNIYDRISNGSSDSYEQYLKGVSKSTVIEIAQSEGIKLKSATFKASQNGQDSNGDENDKWTVVGDL
ncbi:hypothetical protein [Paenibacillus durus]|uniref:Mannosyl-glycoprotein endo-beta-N-acetylglucosamidase-like domain-containing protein n=1 Tax=Paenibacillus durus ATCC 35681 TaxID=1333534 RepID=A0A0F7F9X9_PAEDU|nr:hypothetical protein [Paenibacillus durus]AKG35289.1 hypothetical protein VK70_12480 [Paenibacillus durus ATCC 35681]